jgi:transposase
MIFSENELQKHYRLLLGVESPWQVKNVKLELSEKRVEIELAWTEGAKAPCPVCGQECTLYDYAPERTWRHLDTMQFETILRARVPRVNCATDGVKTIAVPWAEPGGRFSRLKPLIKVARMLKSHLENLLTYLRHPITNAVTEGLNSKVQMIKSNARGFRSFDNYRIRILFFCAKLNLYPL